MAKTIQSLRSAVNMVVPDARSDIKLLKISESNYTTEKCWNAQQRKVVYARKLFETHDVKTYEQFSCILWLWIPTHSDILHPVIQTCRSIIKFFSHNLIPSARFASEGPCILVGRCADYALEEFDNVLSVFIHADMDARVRRIARIYDLTDAKAKDLIKKTDKRRSSYYNYYSNKKWGAAESYNICLDSSLLGIDGTAKAIEQLVALKETVTDRKL